MKKTRVKDVVLAVTYKCNARCLMCNIWQSEHKAPELNSQNLSYLPANLKNINITGGEPFLKNDLVEIVKIIAETCPKAEIVISTNGFAAELILEKIKKIIAVKPDVGIAISIDGEGAAHDKIRGVENGFAKAMATAEALKKLRVKNLKIAFTLGDYNYEELPKVYYLAERLKLEFSLALVHSSGNYFNKENKIEKKEEIIRRLDWLINQELRKWNLKNWARAYFAYGIKYFINAGKRVLPDYSGELNIFISPEGVIYPNDIACEKIGAINSSGFVLNGVQKAVAENWMICTARQAIIRHWLEAGLWIARNKFLNLWRFSIDRRTISQYEYEKEAAYRLLNSTKDERKYLYRDIYNGYFKKFPEAFLSYQNSKREVDCIKRLVNKKAGFLEIGTGDGHFAKELARYVNHITTIDVNAKSKNIIADNQIIKYSDFNGLETELPKNYFSTAYSNQVFEHLHPQDVFVHLAMVKSALEKNGIYIIITPHKFCGPHDISKYFNYTASGMHLREYTYSEILEISQKAGFRENVFYYQRNRFAVRINKKIILVFEKNVIKLPRAARKMVGRIFLPSIMVVLKK